MKARVAVLVPLLALVVPSAAFAGAAAGNRLAESGFTIDMPAATPGEALMLTISGAGEPRGPVLGAIGWQPRPSHYPSHPPPHESSPDNGDDGNGGATQLHAGVFAPDGYNGNQFDLGFRAGANIDKRVQIGLGADWSHKNLSSTTIVHTTPLPGGGTAEQQIELAKSSTNLFPFMAYLQFAPGGKGLVPYLGVGGGYEALLISATDFQTGSQYSATFGGWGWQAWGGLAIPLGNHTRLVSEVFRNTSNVERNVNDPLTGQTLKEVVNVDGVGARFGLGWGF